MMAARDPSAASARTADVMRTDVRSELEGGHCRHGDPSDSYEPKIRIRRNHREAMSTMHDISGVVRGFVEEVLNQGRIDAVDRFFRDDMVEHVPFPGQGSGLQGLKEVLREMRTAFPDMHWTIEEQLTERDRVLTRFEWTGTHRGAFLGVPATGRPVKVWGMVIDRVEEGRIKETRIIMDMLGLMMQLGAVLPPGQ
ncbi:ester cyclase [Paraburkholderia gardini]|nr:ester cyclase [Paraburkholderia gardini]